MSSNLPRWLWHLLATIAVMAFVLLTVPASPHGDLCSYYSAGLVANEAGTVESFDLKRLNERHRSIHSGRRVGPFLYSPLYLAPARMLATQEFVTAERINQLGIAMALGGLLFLILESTTPLSLRLLLCLAFALGNPVRVQFIYLNWSAWLALFLGLALFLTARKRTWPAALAWALAIHLKAYVGLFLLPLLLTGKRKLAGAIVACGLGLSAVSLLWSSPSSYTGYLRTLFAESAGGVSYFFNQVSIQPTLARYFAAPREWPGSNRPIESVSLELLFWISLPLFAYAVYRLRDRWRTALALTVPYLLLFIPKIWDHTQILFFTLFLLAVLPRRAAVISGLLLIASWAYFPLVQRHLLELLQGEGSLVATHALLLFYPLLNLLAAAALLGPREPVATPEAMSYNLPSDAPASRTDSSIG